MLQLSNWVRLQIEVSFIHALQPSSTLLTISLGSTRFARTTQGISLWFLFLRVLRYFNSPGSLPFRDYWVSPFGDLRVKAYLAAPRSLSQPYYVLHRLLLPRHPPCTLSNLNIQISESRLILRSFDLGIQQRSRIQILLQLFEKLCFDRLS